MNIKKPTWANTQKTLINCEVEHPDYGWIPFTASPNDPERHGRNIFAGCLAGDHGPIADYVPPPLPSTEQLASEVRVKRNAALTASDWTQLPDAQAAMSESMRLAWAAYRQALRDVSNQPGFPQTVEWPVTP